MSYLRCRDQLSWIESHFRCWWQSCYSYRH